MADGIIISSLQATPRPVAIVGWEEGLAGQVSGWIEKELNFKILLYINPSDTPLNIDEKAARNRPAKQFDFPINNTYKGKELLNSSDFASALINRNISCVVIALSDPHERQRVFEYLQLHPKLEAVTCIHPSSVLLTDAIIGKGVIIEPNCYVGYRAEIGNCVHLRAGSQVDHQSVLQDYVTLSPGAVIAGNSLIGEYTTIHTNATIINRIVIGPENIVGAGAVVIRSHTKSNCILVGCPARVIEQI